MSIEAMKQAIEALENVRIDYDFHGNPLDEDNKQIEPAITSLRQAIAEAEKQEPLEYWNAVEGWVKLDEVREHFDSVNCGTIYKNNGEGRVPLYTHPQPKREWVGLTDEEIDEAVKSCNTTDTYKYFRAVEAKLKEKNT